MNQRPTDQQYAAMLRRVQMDETVLILQRLDSAEREITDDHRRAAATVMRFELYRIQQGSKRGR